MSGSENRPRQLAVIAAFAALIVAVAIVASETDEAEPTAGADLNALFADIPQRESVLGDPKAEVTLIEFADLQCPFCAQFSEEVVPGIVEDYVRPGRLAMEFRPLTFIGPDSESAARVAVAAGEQDLLWQYVAFFYRDQEAENSGYADEDFLLEVGSQVDGLDEDAALAGAGPESVTRDLDSAKRLAADLGVNSTPSFAIASGNEKPQPFDVPSLDSGDFRAALDEAIAGR